MVLLIMWLYTDLYFSASGDNNKVSGVVSNGSSLISCGWLQYLTTMSDVLLYNCWAKIKVILINPLLIQELSQQ